MVLDEKQLYYIFSYKNIKLYFYLFGLIALTLFTMLFIIVSYAFDNNKDFYYNQLVNTEQYKTSDVRLLCSIISCDYAYIEEETGWYKYIRKGMSLEKTDPHEIPKPIYGSVTSSLDTIVKYKNYTFIKDNDSPLTLVRDLFITLSLLIFIVYNVMFIKYSARRYLEEQHDKGHITNYIENKLQRNITEVIHHEMGGPVAVIRSEIEAMFKAICNEKCQYKRSYDNAVKQKIQNIQCCLSRIDDIMGFMRDAKRIKNSEAELPIYNLIYSITSTVKCFKIGRIDADYENIDVMKKFTIEMKNGLFSNIIQVMVNNSFEAKSTRVKFSAELVNYNHINLYVEDNGTGIRDSMGKIIKDCNDIYKYGYSTKNSKGEVIIKKSTLRYLLSLFGIRINITSTVRGIGLNLNKQILNRIGGDITVVKTSEKGTTFKLYLPVKKIRDNNIGDK